MECYLVRSWRYDQAFIGALKTRTPEVFTFIHAYTVPLPTNTQDITQYRVAIEHTSKEMLQTQRLVAGKDFWSMMRLEEKIHTPASNELVWSKGERILAVQYTNDVLCLGMAFSDAPLESICGQDIELYNAREFFHQKKLSGAYKSYLSSQEFMVAPETLRIPQLAIKKVVDMKAALEKKEGAVYEPMQIVHGTLLIPAWEMAPPKEEKSILASNEPFVKALTLPPKDATDEEFQQFMKALKKN
jgi:hypothetical protein